MRNPVNMSSDHLQSAERPAAPADSSEAPVAALPGTGTAYGGAETPFLELLARGASADAYEQPVLLARAERLPQPRPRPGDTTRPAAAPVDGHGTSLTPARTARTGAGPGPDQAVRASAAGAVADSPSVAGSTSARSRSRVSLAAATATTVRTAAAITYRAIGVELP